MSVRIEQLGSQWTDFREKSEYFSKSCREKLMCYSNLAIITDTLLGDR